MIIDYSASIVTGGGLRARIEALRGCYAEGCGKYLDDILARRGKAFADSACGFLLLDSLLQKHGIARSELAITPDSNGRPRSGVETLDFSVSHSEGCAMCALAVGEGASVGVDVQRERPYSLEKMTELARTFMNDDEFKRFGEPATAVKPVLKAIPISHGDKDVETFIAKNREFYTAWTRRESYAKRIGSDIFDNLKTADIAGEHYLDGVISSCGERYYFSICAPEEAFAEELDEPGDFADNDAAEKDIDGEVS